MSDREKWIRTRKTLLAVWEAWRSEQARRYTVAFDVLRNFTRSPAYLDLLMASGQYEDDLAESHGDAEDVFI